MRGCHARGMKFSVLALSVTRSRLTGLQSLTRDGDWRGWHRIAASPEESDSAEDETGVGGGCVPTRLTKSASVAHTAQPGHLLVPGADLRAVVISVSIHRRRFGVGPNSSMCAVTSGCVFIRSSAPRPFLRVRLFPLLLNVSL